MTTKVLDIKVSDNTMAEITMFDENGRCVPDTNFTSPVHTQTRRYFQIEQSELDYQASYERLDEAFGVANAISVEEFQARVETILNKLSESEESGILNGVMVPFILPKAAYGDIGQALESDYLPAVEKAFLSIFPDYSFTNYSPKSLDKQLRVADGSRHEHLLNQMQQEVVVGVYFPCLLEYSVSAAIEQTTKLPEQFMLAGGFDSAAAFISMPNLLYREEAYPPLLWLSGLESVEENVGYHFEAYGYDLTFNRRVHLGQVAEYWASGLTVIG
jgi:hypothetical protein